MRFNGKNRKKMLAIGMLAVYMLSVFALVVPSEYEIDAGTGDTYTYVLTTAAHGVVTAVSKDGSAATPIKDGMDSWGFDSETGYGPFNSFYAAFSTSTGKLVTHIDPYDLSRSIDPSDDTNYQGTTEYNIMWVLPTVYWKADAASLTLTNNPGDNWEANGWCALGHTIDGKVYNYLAIGVYEAYVDSSKMYSISDKYPTDMMTIAMFRTLAEANIVDGGYAMQWNFFQWTLYKMAVYTVIGSKNSQSDWAYGEVENWESYENWEATMTGQTNNTPYFRIASDPEHSNGVSKVFIENSWGNVTEFVDNVIFSDRAIRAGYTHNASDSPSNVLSDSYSLPRDGYIISTYTENEVWDLPGMSYDWDDDSGQPGDYIVSYTGDCGLRVGGSLYDSSAAGVALILADQGTFYYFTGSRLAYVFDSDPFQSYTITYNTNGGTLAVTEEKVNAGQSITLPTPTRSGYRFDGWYDGNTLVTSPYTPTSDVTLTAHWTQYAITVNNSLLQTVYSATPNVTLTSLTNVVTSGSAVVLPDLGYQKVTYQGQEYLYLHTGWSYTNSNTPTLSKTQSIPNADAIGKTVYSTWAPVISFSDPSNIGSYTLPNTVGTASGLNYIVSGQTTWPDLNETSTGYTHIGFIDRSDNSTHFAGDTLPTLTRSISAISTWMPQSAVITYKSAVTEQTIATLSVPKGTACVLFAPNTDDVHAFAGWYTDKACTQRYNPLSTVNNDLTLWASIVDAMRFTETPQSNGSITPYDVDLGTFLFDATLSESAHKVLWDFGDGTTSEERLIYHTYETPGKYTVTLTTTNYYGETDTRTYSVLTAEEEQMNTAGIIIGFAIILLAGIFIGRRFL